jgi:hypothetical protein
MESLVPIQCWRRWVIFFARGMEPGGFHAMELVYFSMGYIYIMLYEVIWNDNDS